MQHFNENEILKIYKIEFKMTLIELLSRKNFNELISKTRSEIIWILLEKKILNHMRRLDRIKSNT